MPQYKNPSTRFPRLWKAISASSYTIPPQESGLGFTNAGASGAVTFILPSAFSGRNFAFFNVAGHSMTVQAAGSDQISVNQTLSSSVDDGGAVNASLEIEVPQGAFLWNATSASAAYLPAGGLPSTSGTWTSQANPVIPFIAGHRFYMLSMTITSNAIQADGQGLDFQTSAVVAGTSPDTGTNYMAAVNGNSFAQADAQNKFFWGHWSGPSGGADPIEITLTIDSGATGSSFIAWGTYFGIDSGGARTSGNVMWQKINTGQVLALRGLPDNVVGGFTSSGSWLLQALS